MLSTYDILHTLEEDIKKLITQIETPLLKTIEEQQLQIEDLKAQLLLQQSNTNSPVNTKNTPPYVIKNSRKFAKVKKTFGSFITTKTLCPVWSIEDAKMQFKEVTDKFLPVSKKLQTLKLLAIWNKTHNYYPPLKLIDAYTDLLTLQKGTLFKNSREHRTFLKLLLNDSFNGSLQIARFYKKLKLDENLLDLQCFFWHEAILNNADVSTKTITPFYWLALTDVNMLFLWSWEELQDWLLFRKVGTTAKLHLACLKEIREKRFPNTGVFSLAKFISDSSSTFKLIGYTVNSIDAKLDKVMRYHSKNNMHLI